MNTIQTTCPHILRYLTTAVITNKRRRNQLNDLVRVLQQESHSYSDPITEFLEDLYANFDFDAAQKKLRECENVLPPFTHTHSTLRSAVDHLFVYDHHLF